MVEAMLPLLVLYGEEGGKLLPQVGNVLYSFAGRLRQMSIEMSTLSEALKNMIENDEVDPLTSNQMEMSRVNITLQFKNFCKRHANLADSAGAQF